MVQTDKSTPGCSCNAIYRMVVEQAVPYIQCHRKCQAYAQCKFSKPGEHKCGLLCEFFKGYVRTTVPFWSQLDFEPNIREYVKHAGFLSDAILVMQNWIWCNIGRDAVAWHAGMHPGYNKWNAINIASALTQYLAVYMMHLHKREFQFRLIVEGRSEKEAAASLLEALQAAGPSPPSPSYELWTREMQDIGGWGNVKHLEHLLRELRSARVAYYLLLDNHRGVRSAIKKLVDKSLLDASGDNFSVFKASLEESFPNELIANAACELWPQIGLTRSTVAAWKRQGKAVANQIKALLRQGQEAFDKPKFARALGRLLGMSVANRDKRACRAEIMQVLRKIGKYREALFRDHHLAPEPIAAACSGG